VDALFDSPPFPVLGHFAPHTRGLAWRRAPAGFSGALVWRGGEGESPRVALKAWPPGVAADRVRRVHAWMARAARLPFIPTVFAGAGGETAFAGAGRVWDCCRWQPGRPPEAPSRAEVEAACEAVARIHLAWEAEARRGPCPGVSNRLRILAENEPLLAAGPGALPPVAPALDPLLRRALAAVGRAAPALRAALQAWAQTEFAIQPCVRDLRSEHVLFAGGRVAGVIDFGAADLDSPAVDLARLLLDWGGGFLDAALAAYRRVRQDFAAPGEFVRLLADSGAACSALGWVARLSARREAVSDYPAVAARLAHLAGRVEQFPLA
jgi:homoserine kinase type II